MTSSPKYVSIGSGQSALEVDALRIPGGSPTNNILAHDPATGSYKPASSALFGGKVFSVTYPMAGGALDYTLDSQWNPALYPDVSGGITLSGPLGDGVDVPQFRAMMRANFAANGMTRTAGGRLRIKPQGSNNGNPWPGNNSAPQLMFLLPRADRLTVEFTLSMGNFAGPERLQCGILQRLTGTANQPVSVAQISWTPNSSSSVSQSAWLWDALNSATLTTYVTSNVCTRHYKFVLEHPNAQVLGGAVGSLVADTHLGGRSAAFCGATSNLVFFLGLGAAGVTTANWYGEIGDLTISGTRYLV